MTARHDRLAVLNLIAEHQIMDLFATPDPDTACRVADAIHAGGGRIIEFTNRVPFAAQVFEKLRRHLDAEHPDMVLGVGSVEDPATAVNFMSLGAEFIVSPIFLAETAEVCNLPGVETSSAEKAIATLREARKQSPLTGIFCRLGVPLGVRVVRLLETVTVFQHGPYPLPASAGRKFYAWSMAEAADAVIVQ